MPNTARVDMRLTIEDFEFFPDDGRRHGLLDGELPLGDLRFAKR